MATAPRRDAAIDPAAEMKLTSATPASGTISEAGKPTAQPIEDKQLVTAAENLVTKFNRLKNDNSVPFHPVLIFGTSNSGKSNMLASLLTLPQRNTAYNFTHDFMELDYPGHPEADQIKGWAREFYDQFLPEFLNNNKVTPTRRKYPFFVPIKATFGPTKVARMAFLESQGEWLNAPDNGYEYEPLKAPIIQILKTYEAPISVIFVLPAASDSELSDEDVRQSHRAISYHLREFRRYREDLTKTNMLFLISKWDALYSPVGNADPFSEDNFFNPSSETIVNSVRSYPEAWTTYAMLPNVPKGKRSLLQYCATRFVDGGIVETDHEATFAQYNRIIWNWLYGNIFQSGTTGEGQLDNRQYLYQDLNPDHFKSRTNYYEMAMRLAVSIVRG